MQFKQKILFSKEECDSILKRYIVKPIGEIKQQKHRSYISKKIDWVKDSWILDRLINWIETELNIKIDWDNTSFKEFYLQSYNEGDKFETHSDNVYNRAYGMGVLLNDTFEGGEFIVHLSNSESVTFDKKIGNCYLFHSHLLHEVKVITKGNRNVLLLFLQNSQIMFKRNQLI
jgi:hypothetical protein